ncbi:MAG: MFS transporter [Candidatus Korobacteraceae bacterium]|jgi:sugar phosphate permease
MSTPTLEGTQLEAKTRVDPGRRAFVLGLIFIAYLFCYVDRMVMSTCIPYIGKDLNLSKTAMGMAMSAFFMGYTVFQIPGGIMVDRFGPRLIMTIAFTVWSLFTGVTGMVVNFVQLLAVRVFFGIGEAPFPAASMKSIALWFEPSKRATATSIILSSNALGPAIAPLLAVAIMAHWGWRGTFYSLVLPGLLVVALVAIFVTDDPHASKGQARVQAASATQAQYSFWQVLKEPTVWKATIMFFVANMAGWGFKSWLPGYLVIARHMSMKAMGVAASIPFFAGVIGYLFGGWISDGPFKDNRKIPVVIFQLVTALLFYLTYTVASITMLIIYQTLAGFFLSAMLAATWALPVSSVSKKITGRAIGIFNTGGQLAGLVSPTVIGYLVDISKGSFNSSFIFMISCLLVASLLTMTLRRPVNQEE